MTLYWRISMGGEPSALRYGTATRGGFAPHRPGNIAPGPETGDTHTPVDYMAEVVRASEGSGFVGGLLPSFPETDDPWAAASELAAESETYRFMIAFQPGFLHPVQAARMSATLQLATGGRVVYNIISGGGGPQQLWWGDKVAHDDRYARTSEFLDVLKGIWNNPGFDFDGQVLPGRGRPPAGLRDQPLPRSFSPGPHRRRSTPRDRHADYYLSWLRPFGPLTEKFAAVRRHADASRLKSPKFAVRVDVLARETEEEAWDEIRRGWERRDGRRTGETGDAKKAGESVGWARSQQFGAGNAAGGYRDLEIAAERVGRLRPAPPRSRLRPGR